jgi:hypothetical protein
MDQHTDGLNVSEQAGSVNAPLVQRADAIVGSFGSSAGTYVYASEECVQHDPRKIAIALERAPHNELIRAPGGASSRCAMSMELRKARSPRCLPVPPPPARP